MSYEDEITQLSLSRICETSQGSHFRGEAHTFFLFGEIFPEGFTTVFYIRTLLIIIILVLKFNGPSHVSRKNRKIWSEIITGAKEKEKTKENLSREKRVSEIPLCSMKFLLSSSSAIV